MGGHERAYLPSTDPLAPASQHRALAWASKARLKPWRVQLALGGLAAAAFCLVPTLSGRDLVHSLASLAAVVAMALGIRLNRPANRTPWILFSLGLLAASLGDIVSLEHALRSETQPPFPSLNDGFYLIGYTLAVVGLVKLVIRRGERLHAGALCDAALFSVAGGLYLWLFVIEPTGEAQSSLGSALNSALYPCLDLLLLVLLTRIAFGRFARNRSQQLLALGVGAMLTSDVAVDVYDLHARGQAPSWMYVGGLLAYVFWGASALHPTMAAHFEDERPQSSGFSRLRVVALGAALVAVPVSIALQQLVLGGIQVWDTSVLALGVALLTLARIVLFIRAEQRQRQAAADSESRFRSLVEHSNDIITILDAEGRVTYESPGVEALLGRAPAERIGGSSFDNIHPDDLAIAEDGLRSLLAGESLQDIQIRIGHKDGSWRTVEFSAHNRLDDPAIGGIVINSHDVTHRVALAEELRQAQKMEVVGRLAGGIAHDFNNLLTAISGYAELAKLRVEDDEELSSDIAEIQQSAARAALLTKQLLAFSRRQALHSEVVFLRDVIDDMLRMLERIIGEDVEILTDYPEEHLPVLVDPSQLEQVVANLAVNARDAMPDGGTLALRLRAEEADLGQGPEPCAVLSVSDSGEGMDEETLSHIFEPFYTTKEVGKGTGLGLPTVYGIVQQFGGRLEVSSAPGQGATFSIYLPTVPMGTSVDPTAQIAAGTTPAR